MFFDKNGVGIRELVEQMSGYHYEKAETLTAEEMKVVRKDDDRVAALEYAVEALETALAPMPIVVQRSTDRRRTYGNLRAPGV